MSAHPQREVREKPIPAAAEVAPTVDEPVPADEPVPVVTDEAADTDGWERRRRLAEVFGDVLPETTRDERGPSRPERESASDAWLRAQVPPHHG